MLINTCSKCLIIQQLTLSIFVLMSIFSGDVIDLIFGGVQPQ